LHGSAKRRLLINERIGGCSIPQQFVHKYRVAFLQCTDEHGSELERLCGRCSTAAPRQQPPRDGAADDKNRPSNNQRRASMRRSAGSYDSILRGRSSWRRKPPTMSSRGERHWRRQRWQCKVMLEEWYVQDSDGWGGALRVTGIYQHFYTTPRTTDAPNVTRHP
jgi:hypothetical protein